MSRHSAICSEFSGLTETEGSFRPWHDLLEDLLSRIQAPIRITVFAVSSGPLNLPREGDNVLDQQPVDEICRANRLGNPL